MEAFDFRCRSVVWSFHLSGTLSRLFVFETHLSATATLASRVDSQHSVPKSKREEAVAVSWHDGIDGVANGGPTIGLIFGDSELDQVGSGLYGDRTRSSRPAASINFVTADVLGMGMLSMTTMSPPLAVPGRTSALSWLASPSHR